MLSKGGLNIRGFIKNLLFSNKLYKKNNGSTFAFIALICSAIILSFPCVAFQSDEFRTYQMKAAFVYNFIKFIDWPEESLKNSKTIYVGIMDKNGWAEAFAPMDGKNVKGMMLNVKHIEDLQDIKMCHVLFISKCERFRLKQIIESAKGYSVLTVGDVDEFNKAGGIIRFYTEKNKMRFEINISAALQANLKISSKLLEVATIMK